MESIKSPEYDVVVVMTHEADEPREVFSNGTVEQSR